MQAKSPISIIFIKNFLIQRRIKGRRQGCSEWEEKKKGARRRRQGLERGKWEAKELPLT